MQSDTRLPVGCDGRCETCLCHGRRRDRCRRLRKPRSCGRWSGSRSRGGRRHVSNDGVLGAAAVVPSAVGGVVGNSLRDWLYDEARHAASSGPRLEAVLLCRWIRQLPIEDRDRHDATPAWCHGPGLQRGAADERVVRVAVGAAGDVLFVAPGRAALARTIHQELHAHRDAGLQQLHALRLRVHGRASQVPAAPPNQRHDHENDLAGERGDPGAARELGDSSLPRVQVSVLLRPLVVPCPSREPTDGTTRTEEATRQPTKDVEPATYGGPTAGAGFARAPVGVEASPLLRRVCVAPGDGHADDRGMGSVGLLHRDGISRPRTFWDNHLDHLAIGPCSKEGVARPDVVRHHHFRGCWFRRDIICIRRRLSLHHRCCTAHGML
mmetsp:Transcript_28650/g.72613  ORF Transcript_28650/g.72613 Transcript_28650/m.72613 type:complete len:381 (-) Transcript_28650:104-1246(-)